MAYEPPIECPQCGRHNSSGAQNCANCGLDLAWALENWDHCVTGPQESHPPVILRVEDDDGMVKLFELIFTRAGYRVAGARDGLEALDLMQHFVPDLIVTDEMMPHMSGVDMISRLKADPLLEGVPVVMQSALGDYETMIAAMEAGAMGYLRIPMENAHLVAVVDAVLARNALPPLILFAHVSSPHRLEDSLGDRGYRVLEPYPSGDTARGAKSLRPNVIAIGLQSSIRSGLDLLAELKADDAVRDIPVVMLTAGTSPLALLFIRWRAAALGAQAVYSGPLAADALAAVFRAELGEA